MARFNDNLIKAIDHIKLCVKLYRRQMNPGRYGLHEHPWGAKSWQIPEREELLQDPRVQVAYADQCQFGLTSKTRAGSDERTCKEAHWICQQLMDDRQTTEEDMPT